MEKGKSKQDIKPIELMCASCGNTKKSKDFYISYQQIHSTTGRIPYCKQCLKQMIVDENGNVQLDLLKNMLQIIDRPFIWDIWVTSSNADGDSLGVFMKNLALLQNRYLTWKDSVFDPQTVTQMNYNTSLKQSNFVVTDEIVDKWGLGYKTEEYVAFEKKYDLLKNNYTEKTAMHTEALLNYIRYRVKEEMATAAGLVKEAKEWGGMAKDAATAAKINPSQLSKADLTEGLNTISELSQAIEREVDIIPILPRFKYRPNDALDFNIWCYVNYERHLKGMPLVEYEDIYKFYDERKADYIKQYGDPYGIFDNEPTAGNRENILKFIKDDEAEETPDITIEGED